MRSSGLASGLWASALLLSFVGAGPAGAQARPGDRAPIIRVYSQNGPGVASNYVTPAIVVSEDSYVFAVSMDFDGQVQVLQPAYPDISVRVRRHRELRLPNFFAGFSRSRREFVDAVGSSMSYYDDASYQNDSRGTVIALASRFPFNLERVTSGRDWNFSTIRRLLEYRSPFAAAQALASYLGAKGDAVGYDYMRFAPLRNNYYASSSFGGGLYSCDLYGYGYTNLSFNRLAVLSLVQQLRAAGRNVYISGYDFCGMPIVVYGPSRSFTTPQPQRPGQNPADTLKAPRTVPLGYLPIPRHQSPPAQQDYPGIVMPGQLGGSAGEVLIDRRNGTAGGEVPRPPRAPAVGTIPVQRTVPIERTIPVERPAPQRRESPAAEPQPPREFARPVPREAPPPRPEPVRVPERLPEASPPPPSPPAPAQSEPRPRPVERHVPPPKR